MATEDERIESRLSELESEVAELKALAQRITSHLDAPLLPEATS